MKYIFYLSRAKEFNFPRYTALDLLLELDEGKLPLFITVHLYTFQRVLAEFVDY
jgi:hypothetical protein